MSDYIFDDADLSAEQAQGVVDDLLRGADDGELYLERGSSEALTFDDGRLKTASFDSSRGFGLRCVADETTGFAQSTDMSIGALQRAAGAAGIAKSGYSGTAAAHPARTNGSLYHIRPLVRLNVSVTAERGGHRETGFAGAGGRAAYDEFVEPSAWKKLADEALRRVAAAA